MSLDALKAALSQASNLSQLKGLSAAYGTLMGGIPTLDGFANLMAANNQTNFGAGPGPIFNDENIIINTLNALYQGNTSAKSAFNAIIGGGTSIPDLLTSVYNFVIPAAARTQSGLDYFKSQAGFYTGRAAELGIPDASGAAVVAFASLTKIAVDNGIGGLGDTLNDLIKAVNNGSAAIPQSGLLFTPLETADGTQFDADDTPGGGGAGPVYSIAVSPSSVVEGNAGSGHVITFTVTRTGDVSKAGSVSLTLQGTADIGGDYTFSLPEASVSFAAGASSASFTATVLPDTVFEPDETVSFYLTNITGGGSLGTVTGATALITNDDTAPLVPTYSIAVSPSSVAEGNSGSGNVITYTVVRTGNVSQAGSVAVTLSGTAGAGDYTTSLTGNAIAFAAGQNQLNFTVTTTPDTTVEANETVIATLGAITGGGNLGATTSVTGTITNDDTGQQALIQATNTQVITGTTDGDLLTVTALAPTVASDLLGGTNTILLTNGVNISAATYNATGGNNVYELVDGGSATMSLAQSGFISKAPGINTVTIAASGTLTGNAQVENYILAAGNDSFDKQLPSSGTHSVNIAAGGSDIIRFFNYTFNPSETGVIEVFGFDVANDRFASKNFNTRYGEESHSFGETITIPNQAIGLSGNGNLARSIFELETSAAGSLTASNYRSLEHGGAVETLIANAMGANLGDDPTVQILNTVIIYVTNVGAAIYQFEVQKAVLQDDLTINHIAGVELIGVLHGVAANSITSANYSL